MLVIRDNTVVKHTLSGCVTLSVTHHVTKDTIYRPDGRRLNIKPTCSAQRSGHTVGLTESSLAVADPGGGGRGVIPPPSFFGLVSSLKNN